MHWDAMLDDGRGDLLFGRPIRWLLFTYGGRVVPFTIARTPGAAERPGAGRHVGRRRPTAIGFSRPAAAPAARSRSARSTNIARGLLENFVVLERSERHDKIAQRAGRQGAAPAGRVSRVVRHANRPCSSRKCPISSSIRRSWPAPSAIEFLELPEEVLTTTLIHHQHYFPVEGEDGRLKNAFLAVINTEPDNERTIARNAERVVTARLRDARFFWEADRKVDARIAARSARHAVVPQEARQLPREGRAHRAAGADASRSEHLGASDSRGRLTPRWPRACRRRTSTTDMVREFTELQGKMGGIYAREERLARRSVEGDLLPLPADWRRSGRAADRARSSGRRRSPGRPSRSPTSSTPSSVSSRQARNRPAPAIRTALRRAAQGVVKILVDLGALTGVTTSRFWVR